MVLLAAVFVGCSSPSPGGRATGGETGTGGTAEGTGGAVGSGGSGGSGGRADGGGKPVADAAVPVDLAPDAPAGEFCPAYAAKVCERLGACSQPYLIGVYGTAERCAQRIELDCRGEARAAGTGLTSAAATACGAALAAASCDDFMGGTVPACQLKGTLAKGAPCGSASQCSSGFCRLPETAFCGKCDGAAAEGAACDSDAACEFPLLCSEAGRCAKPSGEGEFCNETKPCKPGPLFCGADNTCRRPSGDGKACNRTGNAPLQPCEIGFTCRPTANGTCRPIRLVDAGLSCGISPTGSTVVLCTASGSCVNNICKPPGEDGAACTPSPLGDSGGCLAPARCLGGLCQLPDPASCR